MTSLTQLWSEKTGEFTTIQKAIIGLTLSFILSTSVFALVLLIMEFTK